MNRPPPNGHFIRDFLVWGTFRKRSTIAKGFVIYPPDLRGAGEGAAVRAHESLVKYLQSISLHVRLQWQWRCNCDYHKALDDYEKVTEGCRNPKEKQVRGATARYYRRLLKERKLRREHLVVFISQTVEAAPPLLSSRQGIRAYYRSILSQFESNYEQLANELSAALGADVAIEPMTRRDNRLYTFLFLNPTANEWQTDLSGIFDDRLSVMENCLTSDIKADRLGRMYFDGHYHALLVLRQVGSHTFEGMIHNLTKTDFLNYQITVNLEPLDTYRIIQAEETEQQNLQKQAAVDVVLSQTRVDTIRRKQATITKLGEGQTRLFNTTVVVRAWNTDETRLAADVSALKAGILSMRNARCYDAHLEATALELFYATLPGNSFHPYAARAFRLEDEHVANLIPYSASFTGDLDQAQALFLSSDRALVGFRFHVNGLVQHTGVAGGTRSGKSAKYNNILYQTGPYFDYDVLVEEGGAHTNYAEDHGSKPMVIQKSGNITINYLDTLGSPLDPDHLAYAISLTSHFAGKTEDERLNSRRRAYLSYYLGVLYREAQEDWARKNAELNRKAQREACAIHQWHARRMSDDDTHFDAYTQLRDRLQANDGEVLAFVAGIAEADITHFIKDPQTAHFAERHAFAYFKPEEYPRHGELAELLRLRPSQEHNREEVAELAALMDNWSVLGEYGPLFDGVTNRRFDSRVVHFELAKADNNDLALRGAIALNITGRIRQRIVSMPRSLKKRFTMEELARLVQMPGGARLALELAAQLAKYNCVFAFILQDFSQIAHIEGISSLLNNTRQWLILRHDDVKELGLFADRILLPESMREAVSKFPIPLNLPAGSRYSASCYFSRSAVPPISGTIHYNFNQNAA
ncbi:MAG TPA: hypothetical protein VG838_08660 [Opitutaceae bacterium]|nr:hypothetical protein [Opitutaceae bacterium]